MEWEAPAIVIDARLYGEGDAVAAVMTEEHGVHRGLARGGASRTKAAIWQVGNLVQVRWVARLSEQLGTFTGELIHPTAALVMDDPLALAALTAACAVTDGALPEREPHPSVFDGLLSMTAQARAGEAKLADHVRWEAILLANLGYGLDLTTCALTGETEDLAYVSPKSGRAVSRAAAAAWAPRLLKLPAFLLTEDLGTPADWRDGLRLTGHFLERDAFGHHHRPLPAARIALYHRVSDLAEEPAAHA